MQPFSYKIRQAAQKERDTRTNHAHDPATVQKTQGHRNRFARSGSPCSIDPGRSPRSFPADRSCCRNPCRTGCRARPHNYDLHCRSPPGIIRFKNVAPAGYPPEFRTSGKGPSRPVRAFHGYPVTRKPMGSGGLRGCNHIVLPTILLTLLDIPDIYAAEYLIRKSPEQ
jgi:hypothetical protein